MDRDIPEKLIRRVMSFDAFFLLAAGFLVTGCELVGYRPMVPAQSAKLETTGYGVSASIERLHVEYTTKNPTYRVDVRIDNQTGREVVLPPGNIKLARLLPSRRSQQSVKASGRKNLAHGESGTYRIVLPNVPIDDGQPYALMLGEALGFRVEHTLPLVRPGQAHLGYLPPTEATWIFAGRAGGGAIRRAPVTAGLGGFEIFIGRQIGRFAFGGFGTLGAGAWGGEMRLRFEPAKVVSIVPFFGYGYYPIVGYLGFNAGHGPRWGFELQFSTGDIEHFGYARNLTKVGIYALSGPVFLNAIDGVAFAGQLGLSFGIF